MNEEMMRILSAMVNENKEIVNDINTEPLVSDEEASEYIAAMLTGNRNVKSEYRHFNRLPNMTTKFINVNGCTMGIITDIWNDNGEQHSEELMRRFYEDVVTPKLQDMMM